MPWKTPAVSCTGSSKVSKVLVTRNTPAFTNQPCGDSTAFKLTHSQQAKKWTAPARQRSTMIALVHSVLKLCRLRNAGCGLLFRHVRLQPDICTPSSKKRCCQNHCKSNCNCYMHLWSPFPLKVLAPSGKHYSGDILARCPHFDVPNISCSTRPSYPTSVCPLPPLVQSHLPNRGIEFLHRHSIA